MATIQQRTREFLQSAADRLRASPLPPAVAARVDQLIPAIDRPCVVAVVGRVKAGKSTFVNALLGSDLARVDAREATATVTLYTYGSPPDPARPVLCHWRNRPATWHSADFLNQLQGHDRTTLELAEGIAYLEYMLLDERLRAMTLVDTPGTGAVVDEHQDRLDEFLQMRQRARERNAADTLAWCKSADAVICLVGPAARASDRDFLEREFGEASALGARSSNVLGVMAKIDLDDEVFARRTELCATAARRLDDRLNTIVPVSAAVQRAIDALRRDGSYLGELMTALRRIAPDRRDMLLESESLFTDEDIEDCSVPAAERRRLRERLTGDHGSQLPWRTFVKLAEAAGNPDLSPADILARLTDIAGFDLLRAKVTERFADRSQLLRCIGALNEMRALLAEIRFEFTPALEKQERNERPRLSALHDFLAHTNGPPGIVSELNDLVSARYDTRRRTEHVVRLHDRLNEEWAEIQHEMDDLDADFDALQTLENHASLFTSDETYELRRLFGHSGLAPGDRVPPDSYNTQFVGERQVVMRQHSRLARDKARQTIFQHAEVRYGALLYGLISPDKV